ncbi:hypothetical protein BKA82DRAFT_4481497 [Pisolithus tinctorius]|nr:hypothetical protein BKA82DRAFT_4481497 [Pisolithus tinctorius]
MDLAIQSILQLTPFANIHAIDDYAHVLAHLVEYWEWDIDVYRSYLNPNVHSDNTYIVLCALVFLTMAEWMHMLYGGLTPEELQERIYAMGHRTFAIFTAIPRLGVVIIRNMEIVVIADSPALACGFIVASMFPLLFPLIVSGARKIQGWIANRRRQHAPEHNGAEDTSTQATSHSESQRSVHIPDDVKASVCHNQHLHSLEGQSGFNPAAEEHN